MRVKIANEQFYKAKSYLAAYRYIEKTDNIEKAINVPALLILISFTIVFAIFLFLR